MQGSLDNPPLVISMSQWKMALLLLIGIGFTAIGVWMAMTNPGDWRGYFCAGFFGLCVVAFIWRFLSPPRLELSRQGVLWFNGRKTLQYPWAEFAQFRAYKPARRAISKHVGYELAPLSPKRGRMTAAARALTGVDGSFGGQWEVSADEIVGLLNQAKAKWG